MFLQVKHFVSDSFLKTLDSIVPEVTEVNFTCFINSFFTLSTCCTQDPVENTLYSILSANIVTNQLVLPNSPFLYFFFFMYEGESSRQSLLQSLQRPAVCQHVQDAAGHALLHERFLNCGLRLNWAVLQAKCFINRIFSVPLYLCLTFATCEYFMLTTQMCRRASWKRFMSSCWSSSAAANQSSRGFSMRSGCQGNPALSSSVVMPTQPVWTSWCGLSKMSKVCHKHDHNTAAEARGMLSHSSADISGLNMKSQLTLCTHFWSYCQLLLYFESFYFVMTFFFSFLTLCM